MNGADDIRVVGIPLDHNSSYLRGAAAAPEKIREAFCCDSSNLWTETGIDLGSCYGSGWQIDNPLEFTGETDPFVIIEREIDSRLQAGKRVLSLGGDHSITYPVIVAHAKKYPCLNILHLDAHPDLYDELGGNRHSHACPFARIMERQLAARLVQVGIRTMNGHQRQQAERFGVEVVSMRNLDGLAALTFAGPLYISIDLDCLDPAFAPGVAHHEPGGMTTREVVNLIQDLPGEIVGGDIVEYNPARDVQGMTGMVAAKLLKELLGRMVGQGGG
jgi:agmatinase